jgi:hypothetical protein
LCDGPSREGSSRRDRGRDSRFRRRRCQRSTLSRRIFPEGSLLEYRRSGVPAGGPAFVGQGLKNFFAR